MQRSFTRLSILLMLGCGSMPLESQSTETNNLTETPSNLADSTSAFGEKGLLPLKFYEVWLQEHGQMPLRSDEKDAIEKAALPAQGNVVYGLYEAQDPHQAIVYRPIEEFKELQNKLRMEGSNFKAIAVIGAGWKMGRSTGFSNHWDLIRDKKYDTSKKELYYLVDYEKNVDPDLVANVMEKNQINQLGNDNFDHIKIENLDCRAMLSKNLWLSTYAALKKGGQIGSGIVPKCRRPVDILLRTLGISYKFELDREAQKKIEVYQKEIEQIKSGTFRGNFGGISGIKLDTVENKQKAIKELQDEIMQWEVGDITITK